MKHRDKLQKGIGFEDEAEGFITKSKGRGERLNKSAKKRKKRYSKDELMDMKWN